MTDDSEPSASPSTNDPTSSPLTSRSRDSRILRARLAFGTEMFKNGTTIVLRNYLLDGEPIQVALYKDGRIEQRDTASHLRQISNLTINVTVNGMSFELDQHSVLSTPNDLIYAINGADQVQILRTLSRFWMRPRRSSRSFRFPRIPARKCCDCGPLWRRLEAISTLQTAI